MTLGRRFGCVEGGSETSPCFSEVELLDVGLVKDEGLSEEDIVALDIEGAESAGLEGFGAFFEFVFGHGDGGVDREVTEVAGVPEDDAVRDALADVAFVFVGQTETDYLHFAGFARLLDGFGGTGDAGGADGHDKF